MKQRYIYIDYLKIIGLFLVILAHVSPPLFINQLRSCDVPLLVIVSGYLASRTYSGGVIKGESKSTCGSVLRDWQYLPGFFVVFFYLYELYFTMSQPLMN